MDDKDHVFARFKDDKPASADRRETLTIPRRAGAPGSRSVEVVHVRSGGAVRDRPQRQDQYVRAASWDGGFPTKQPSRAPLPTLPEAPEAAEPVTHVMPAWEPAATEADAAPVEEPVVSARRGRGRPRKHPVGEPVSAPAETAQVEEPATPRWGRGRPRKLVAATAGAAPAEEPVVEAGHDPGRPRKQPASAPTRRVADPFNASDDGANCMRCGYAIESAREKRGMMTCLSCE
jgi:hypothetical protein